MKKYIKIIAPIVVILGLLAGYYVINSRPVNDNRAIVLDFVQNQDKEYSDNEKIKIVTAYKEMLENNGEDYVDNFFTKEEQMAVTYLGMGVNMYVFRDFKNTAYLNAADSFIDVEGYSKIAGFDVDGTPGADGFVDLANVEIVIDGTSYATADLTAEIASFFERLNKANEINPVNTIYGVDTVEVDDNTRLYITYLDVSYDDSYNVTALRVSGHLVLK